MNKRARGSYRNPVPFFAEDHDGSVVQRCHKRIKFKESPKQKQQHKEENLIISSRMSSKILKEAQIQQKEIDNEENTNAFTDEPHEDGETYEDYNGFGSFLEIHEKDEANKVMEGMINEYEEEDEKLLDRFLSKEEDDDPLPDFILVSIKKKDCNVTSADARPLLEMDTHYIEIF